MNIQDHYWDIVLFVVVGSFIFIAILFVFHPINMITANLNSYEQEETDNELKDPLSICYAIAKNNETVKGVTILDNDPKQFICDFEKVKEEKQ
jgi:hypothetical protein